MIDIIIPAYNAEETLEKTLMSIYLQEINVPYTVTIVDDYSNTTYETLINKYKNLISINYIRLEKNSGSGIARQIGIDKTNNPYIVFIDADDLFYNIESLNNLYKNIIKGYDLVIGYEYIEEINNIIINNGNVHSKIYKRKFLEENNIKFNETRYHEDNFFNNYVLLSNAKYKEIDNITYIYCNNKNSITRSNNIDEFKRLEIYISNINELLNKKIKNKERLLEYLYIKLIYLKKINDNLAEQEKIIFNNWLKKYIPKYQELIYIDEKELLQEIKRIIN